MKILLFCILLFANKMALAFDADVTDIVKNIDVTVGKTKYKVVHKLEHQPFLETVLIEKKCNTEDPTHFFYRQVCKVKSLKLDKPKNQVIIEFQKVDPKSEDYQCKGEVITHVVNLIDDCNKK